MGIGGISIWQLLIILAIVIMILVPRNLSRLGLIWVVQLKDSGHQ